jgi:hypothetical protein
MIKSLLDIIVAICAFYIDIFKLYYPVKLKFWILLFINPITSHLLFPLWCSLLSVPLLPFVLLWFGGLCLADFRYQMTHCRFAKVTTGISLTKPITLRRAYLINLAVYKHCASLWFVISTTFKQIIKKEYKTNPGVHKNLDYGSVYSQTLLDIYPATKTSKLAVRQGDQELQPVIVFIYGGGWRSGPSF